MTTDCLICLEPLGQARHALRCGHAFHSQCLVTWLLAAPRRTCPSCRDCYEQDETSSDDEDSGDETVGHHVLSHSPESPFWTHRSCAAQPRLRAWLLGALRRHARARRAPRSLKLVVETLGRRKERAKECAAQAREARRSARGTLPELVKEIGRADAAYRRAVEGRDVYEEQLLRRCGHDAGWRTYLRDRLRPPHWLRLVAPR